MDTNANNNRESFEDQQVIFVDTHLIQKAVEGLQRAREEFQTLLEQAEGGDASVYYDLGVRYTEGDGTDKDPAQAARWFALASEDGDLRATDLLGRCYQSGAGVEKDEARAAELYRQAAEQDYAPAQCDLGLSYENGSGVEKDEARAAECYLQAAEQDYAPAQTNLAVCYFNGIGVDKDVEHWRGAGPGGGGPALPAGRRAGLSPRPVQPGPVL